MIPTPSARRPSARRPSARRKFARAAATTAAAPTCRAVTEAIESRLMLTAVAAGNIGAVTYATNMEWTDTSQPYNLTGDVHVQLGATLTIGAGVTVTSSQAHTIFVADDGLGAKLAATGVTFDVPVDTYGSTGGQIAGSTFNAPPRFDGTSTTPLTLAKDQFNANAYTGPSYVPALAGNAFAAGSTVYVLNNRSITTNTTWPAIANVAQYQITYAGESGGAGVYVHNGATLTIANGTSVTTDSTARGLYVADDATAAGIVADHVTFNVPLTVDPAGTATLTNDTFNTAPRFDLAGTTNLTLTGDAFVQGVYVQPMAVPALAAASFPTGSTVYVLNNRSVTADTTWPTIPNVAQYEVVYAGESGTAGVYVRNGATLTVAAGEAVTTDNAARDLYVADDGTAARIAADHVTFNVPLTVYSTGAATLTNDTFDTPPRFDVAGTTNLTLAGDTFVQNVYVHPMAVPALPGNSFSPGSTVYVLNNRSITANTTWPAIPNVAQYEIVYAGENGTAPVYVRNGATLTVASGAAVTTDNAARALYVGDDGSGARVVADHDAFNVQVYVYGNATGSLTNDTFQQYVQVLTPGLAGLAVTGDTFNAAPRFDVPGTPTLTLGGDTFAAGATAHPMEVPALAGNAFGPQSTIAVLNNRSVTANTTWPAIPNVAQYEVVYAGENGTAGVYVRNGATLTVAAGEAVTTDNAARDLYVADDATAARIVADHVTFNVPLTVYPAGAATLTNGTFDVAPRFDLPGTTALTLTGDAFVQGVYVHPMAVPALAAASFPAGSTVYVLNNRSVTANTTWPEIPNVAQYQITYAGESGGAPVYVRNGATLTVANGAAVTTDNPARYLVVGDDGTAANVQAAGVTFGTPVQLTGNAGGSLQYDTFNQPLTIAATTTVAVHNDSFATTTVSATGPASATIDLTNNWWGATDSTTILTHITDHHEPDHAADGQLHARAGDQSGPARPDRVGRHAGNGGGDRRAGDDRPVHDHEPQPGRPGRGQRGDGRPFERDDHPVGRHRRRAGPGRRGVVHGDGDDRPAGRRRPVLRRRRPPRRRHHHRHGRRVQPGDRAVREQQRRHGQRRRVGAAGLHRAAGRGRLLVGPEHGQPGRHGRDGPADGRLDDGRGRPAAERDRDRADGQPRRADVAAPGDADRDGRRHRHARPDHGRDRGTLHADTVNPEHRGRQQAGRDGQRTRLAEHVAVGRDRGRRGRVRRRHLGRRDRHRRHRQFRRSRRPPPPDRRRRPPERPGRLPDLRVGQPVRRRRRARGERRLGPLHRRRRRQPRRPGERGRLRPDRRRLRRCPDRLVQRRLQLRRQGRRQRLHAGRQRLQHAGPAAGRDGDRRACRRLAGVSEQGVADHRHVRRGNAGGDRRGTVDRRDVAGRRRE